MLKFLNIKSLKNSLGFSVVEALLAGALFAIIVVTFIGAVIYGEESVAVAGQMKRGSYIAEEGLEATKNIRDAAFSNLTDGAHGLVTTSSIWSFGGASDLTDIFTRVVTIAQVSAGIKSITANSTWQATPQRTGLASLISYLTDWVEASVGNWASVSQDAVLNISGNQDSLKVATAGNFVYEVRDNGSSNFDVINITNPAAPSLSATLSVAGTPANIAVSGNFAYVSSSDNAAEMRVIDITTPTSPTLRGTYNAAGNTNATGIYAVGTTVYLVRGGSGDPEFFIINASNPDAPVLVGSLGLAGDASEVAVSGNFAYVASTDNASELQVINITTPATPTLAGTLDLATGSDANTIAISRFEPTVVIGRSDGSIYIINVTTPTAPSLISSFSAGGSTINDVALGVGETYAFLATANGTAESRVVDIFNTSTPTSLSTFNAAATLNGVVYSESKDRVIAVGNDNSTEILIIEPN